MPACPHSKDDGKADQSRSKFNATNGLGGTRRHHGKRKPGIIGIRANIIYEDKLARVKKKDSTLMSIC